MDEQLLIGISALLHVAAVLVQLTAAFYALKLIRVTGKSTAWVLISGALCLMAVRRSVMLWHMLAVEYPFSPDFWDPSVALAISVCMLAGVLSTQPLFLTIKRAAETLTRAKEDLEIQVAERTEALREANAHLSIELDERRRAEQKLAEYSLDLARSNRELEQFAYVASHDLQEPLRMVSSFTQLLARRYQGKLDRDADEFIAYAVDGANHMQRLIGDLLAFSRVGTRGKPLAPTDSGAALNRALANLHEAIQESRAVLTHDPMPVVLADETQLVQLFQNLIANAIRFQREFPPRVHIAATPEAKEWTFAVRDNGIGIAPEHQERIFVIFQRLHRRADYPGTGIGLALCKKIVERHGGRIWVESEPGKGSAFYFTMSKESGS